ncbi:Heavy metal-associated domain containing protein [Musa troglodytarum]|uniref:Heavy metal-associated domain containing protein n=1 Tax=Musa troglodytarum TaxID=320322 RepID=A0A9E7G4W8_9LILI|nr:Heavy metal-associated domain containing protein [Musa troglodytarum]
MLKRLATSTPFKYHVPLPIHLHVSIDTFHSSGTWNSPSLSLSPPHPFTAGMKANGLVCRSRSATAVCVPDDPRLMILPRQRDKTLVERPRLVDVKCSRLGDPRRFSSGDGRSVTLPMVMKKERVPRKPSSGSNLISSFPPSNHHVFQVVVMRVSLHCQACAGKVRKHISKMEGVTSFSIELESKRVTVMGYVSPEGVLEKISKVKKAEFWPC